MMRLFNYMTLLLVALSALSVVSGFAPTSHQHSRTTNSFSLGATKEEIAKLKEKTSDEAKPFFTGGAFDKMEPEAAKIASRFKTVKDLGWTSAEKLRGSARPRHRAFGGEDEQPVQLKPNYDESNPKCVEKWLTQEEFYAKARDDGPAADTVFCALAGGAAFAERSVCQQKLNQWYPNGKFDEAAFLKTVQEGRTSLAIGWAIYIGAVGTAVLGIVAPTNPLQKALEAGVDAVRGNIGLEYDPSLLGVESFLL